MTLPPWIIEKIKEEEAKKKRRPEPLPLELPLEDPRKRPEQPKEPNPDDGDRGVVIIDPSQDKKDS